MRISALLASLLCSCAIAIPIDQFNTQDELKNTTVGTACTGSGMNGRCTDLVVTKPNECLTAMSGNLPLDRCISSISIASGQVCAFFTLETCIDPAGTHYMLTKGPIKISQLPEVMTNSIQAYICGSNATIFAGNESLASGTVIVDGQGRSSVLQPSADEREVVMESPMEKRNMTWEPKKDGRGVTIFKEQHLAGTQVPGEETAIPGNTWCTDMNNIFGNWDARVRSFAVEPGYKCQFWTEYGCPAQGDKLEVGCEEGVQIRETLDAEFDQKIHSAYCGKIEG